jgi:(p)ppGpp synthase/HD superfamily hydrolase
MNSCWSQDAYIRAWDFACMAHRGQVVPGTDLPYVNHLGLVAMEVMAAMAAGERVAAPDLLVGCALLHDTLEDTMLTHGELLRVFGPGVAAGVEALTKRTDLADKEMQMRDSLARIQQQPPEIWMVKMADRITNLRPPPAHWDEERIGRYRQEAVLIVETLGRASPFLGERLWRKINRYSCSYRQQPPAAAASGEQGHE